LAKDFDFPPLRHLMDRGAEAASPSYRLVFYSAFATVYSTR
jgi:hypothetical protein